MTFDAASLDVALGDAFDASEWQRGWSIPAPLTMSEWADKHRMLTREGSAEPGPWSTSRTPYLRRIMDVLSPSHPCKKVSLRKPTQIGGTEVLNNACGYIVDHVPGPAMVVQPTDKLAKRWSNQRLKTMIAASPVLANKVASPHSRDATNTSLMKEFPGGYLVIAGANSSNDLRSMPARYVLQDEVDEYPDDLEGQGRADEIAERRASTFVRRKIFKASSPTLKATSIIEAEFQLGTMESYHLPCPHCGKLQALVIEQLLPDGTYLCVHGDCGKVIEEHHKTWMLDEANGADWVAEHPERENEHCSFALNSLYAPIGLGYTWKEIAAMRDAAERDPDKQVTFTNTILGMAFEGERQQQDPGEVEQRAEPGLFRGVVPPGFYLLTLGVDCQHDRFAIQVVAFGRGERAFAVEYVEVPGDPSQQDGYGELEAWLKRVYRNQRGMAMLPSVVAIDAGNWGEEVAKFVRRQGVVQANAVRRVLQVGNQHQPQVICMVRGRSAKSDRVVYRPAKSETNFRGKTLARSVGVWGVGTDVAKHILFGRLAADAHVEDVDQRMIRFPGGREKTGIEDHAADATFFPRSYYEGLTAEYFDLGAKKWVKKSRHARNEPLDTLEYAYWAALSPFMRVDLKRESEWLQLQQRYEPDTDLFTASDGDDEDSRGTQQPADIDTEDSRETSDEPEAESSSATVVDAIPARARGQRKPGGGFATRW
ncbi:MAG: phage terminase large subunit family protein [Proteobacteria bacterium]|nr:phage terminase large subunit family protein [Pseudomonadota bacterium]